MNPYIILALILFGMIITLVLQRPAGKLVQRFRERAPIIKKYWKFIVPFVILDIVAYVIVGLYSYTDISFNILGQFSALILAIFIGYIAFSEFGESKFDKLIESASASLDRREFNSAMLRYEEAHAIKPKESLVIGNLLEVYIILGMYEKFDAKLPSYMKYSVEKSDHLSNMYLLSLRSLVVEHMGEARKKIKETIELVDSNPGIRDRFYWSNDEFVSSDAYRVLDEGTQKIISNYFSYLKRQLPIEQEQRFIEGNYEDINPAVETPTEMLPLG